MSRERLAGVVIVLAGLYVFVRPERGSPWSCLAGGTIEGLMPNALSFCSIVPAFVLGSIVSAALVVYGAWLFSTSGVTSSTKLQGAIACATLAVIVVYLLNGLLQGPFSPLHSTVPTQTSAPARSAPPTR